MTFLLTKPFSSMHVKRILAGILLAGASGTLASACVDNESSLFIRGCQAPESTENCGVDADPAGIFRPKGVFDVLSGYGEYLCPLLVGNQIVQRGDSDTLRTETSRVRLYEADVRVFDLAGDPIAYADGSAAEFTVPITGFVDPGTSNNPGYGLAGVTLLDGGTVQGLAGSLAPGAPTEVMANVIVRGRTLGGQEVETGEWNFPITVCSGCLCISTTDPTCCTNPAAAGCDSLDDPIGTCSPNDPYDCRSIGQACP